MCRLPCECTNLCIAAQCADYQEVCRQLGEKDHLLIEQQRQSERDVEAARAEINRLISSQDKERGQLELDLVKARWAGQFCYESRVDQP